MSHIYQGYSNVLVLLEFELTHDNVTVQHISHDATGSLPATVYISQPYSTDRMRHQVNFQAGFNRFEFRVFLLLDWLPNQG